MVEEGVLDLLGWDWEGRGKGELDLELKVLGLELGLWVGELLREFNVNSDEVEADRVV